MDRFRYAERHDGLVTNEILTADGRLTITRSNGQRRYWQLIARVGANPTRYMILENVESSATPPPFAVTSRLVPYERS